MSHQIIDSDPTSSSTDRTECCKNIQKIKTKVASGQMLGIDLENLGLAIKHALTILVQGQTISLMELVDFEMVQLIEEGAMESNFRHTQSISFKDGAGTLKQGFIEIEINPQTSKANVIIELSETVVELTPVITIMIEYKDYWLRRPKHFVTIRYDPRPLTAQDLAGISKSIVANLNQSKAALGFSMQDVLQ